jgi:DNA-binding Lrp family transcriptional regulator
MNRPLDRIDREILGLLQNHGRIPNNELAKRVGLAPSTCLTRVRRLADDGVLVGFHGEVDPRAVGVGLQALISIRLEQHSRAIVMEFREHAVSQPEVIGLFYVAGSVDFLLHVAVKDSDHLRDLSLDRLASRAEVGHLTTSVIFEHVASRTMPIWTDEIEEP